MSYFRDIHGIAVFSITALRPVAWVQTVIQNRFPVKTGDSGAFAAAAASFAADVNPGLAAFRSLGVYRPSKARSASQLGRRSPVWYLVATDDKMIPPDAQRAMAKRGGAKTVEVK